MRTIKCAGVSALLISTLAGPQAYAGGFHLNERSTAALGASLSGSVSSARDVTFATFNPAALKTVESFEAGGNISLVLPIADATIKTGPAAGTKLDADLPAVVPSFAVGYRVNEDLVVGFTTYSPFGLATDYDKFSAVQADARESDLLTVSFSPTVAYDVLDNLTFGASLNVLYAEARLTSNGGRLAISNWTATTGRWVSRSACCSNRFRAPGSAPPTTMATISISRPTHSSASAAWPRRACRTGSRSG